MALNFPNNPTLNQVYAAPSGASFKWNGQAWDTVIVNTALGNLIVVDQSIYGGRADANIGILPNGSGSIVVGANIVPTADSTYSLGTATDKWQSLYVSGNSVFIGNAELSIDNTGALFVNGNAVVTGTIPQTYTDANVAAFLTSPALTLGNAAGFVTIDSPLVTIGNVTGFVNVNAPTIFNNDVTFNIDAIHNGNLILNGTTNFIGDVGFDGNTNIYGGLAVHSGVVGSPSVFTVGTTGLMNMFVPSIPAGDAGLSLIGSSDRAQQVPTNAGTLMQLTNEDNMPGRISLDSFGTGNVAYSNFAFRTARGTAGTPTASQSGDLISRISTNAWGTTGFASVAQGIAQINTFANENFTDTNHGTRMEFRLTPVGSAGSHTVLTLDGAGAVVTGNVAISGTTTFAGPTIFNGLITSNGGRISNGDTVFNGNLTVNGGTDFVGNVIHHGDTVYNGNITILGNTTHTGDTQFLGNLDVAQGATVQGNLIVDGTTHLIGNMLFTGDTEHVGNINVLGITTHTGDVIITGTTTHTGNLNVTGVTKLTGEVNVTGATLIAGNTETTGDSTFTGNVTITGSMLFTGNTTRTGSVTDQGTRTQNGPFIVNGVTTHTGNLNVTGATTLTGEVDVTGATFIAGNITATGATSFSGYTTLTGPTDIDGNLTINGPMIQYGDSIQNGNIELDGKMTVTNDVIFTGTGKLNFNDGTEQASAAVSTVVGSNHASGTLGIIGNQRSLNITTDATPANSPSTIVSRDASGNVAVGNATMTSFRTTSIGANNQVAGSLTVFGNLNVIGTTTTTTAVIQQLGTKTFTVAGNATVASQADGGGFLVGNIAGASVADWTYDNGQTAWRSNISVVPAVNLGASLGSDARQWDNLYANVGDFDTQIQVGPVGTIFQNSPGQFAGNVNSWTQVAAQNLSNGNNASTDFVASADNGDDTVNYIDLGINSSTYNQAAYNIGLANDGYLYVNGGNLTIGTQSGSKALVFFTGGTTADREAGRIEGVGKRWLINQVADDGVTPFQVGGAIRATGNIVGSQLRSTVATGTAPFAVASTTKVTGLNVEQVDGFDASQATVNNTIAVRDSTGNVSSNWFIGSIAYTSVQSAPTNVSFFTNDANYINASTFGVLNANVGAYEIYANANIGTISNRLSTLDANVGAYEIYANAAIVSTNANVTAANAAIVTANTAVVSYVNTVNAAMVANVTATNANVTAANAAIVTANTAMKSYVDTTTSAITAAWTANAATQETEITGLRANITAANAAIASITYGNANVAAFLPTYSGQVGGTLTTAAQPNITSLGTLTALTVSGALNVGSLSIATITASTINAATIGNTGATLTGTLSTAAQPNVTSVGTLTSLTVSGALNATISNAAQPNITSVGTLTGLTTSGNTIVNSTVYAQGVFDNSNRVVSTSTGAGNLTISGAAINLTNVGTATTIGSATQIPVITTDAFGRVIATAIAAVAAPASALTGTTLAAGVVTSSLTTVGTLGSLAVTGNVTTGNVSGTTGGFTNITGTVQTAAQPNITSVGTLSSLTVSGALNAIISTAAQTNITSVGTLFSLAVTGNVTTGNVSGTTGGFTNITGTLQTAAQTNITSVGTLTGLTVSGNTAHTSTVYAQGIFDNSNRVLSTTSGAGNLTIAGTAVTLTATGPGAATVGSSTAIPVITTDIYGRVSTTSTAAVIAPAGTLTGTTLNSTVVTSSLTSVGTLGSLAVTGNVTTGNVSGTTVSGTTASFTNLGGTLTTAAQTNITSVGTLGSLAVTGNVSAGNVSVTNNETVGGNVTVTGNISGNNVSVTNKISTATISTTSDVTVGGELMLAAGTTAIAPLVFQTGVLQTTTAQGDVEFDGNVFYATPFSTQRGIIPSEQFYVLGSGGKTLTGGSGTPTSILGVGVTVSGSTRYHFALKFAFTKSGGGQTPNIGFAGTATPSRLSFYTISSIALNGATLSGYSTLTTGFAAGVVLGGAVAGGTASAEVFGVLDVAAGGGGTFIPTLTFSGGATTVATQPGALMRIFPTGTQVTTGNTAVGTWA